MGMQFTYFFNFNKNHVPLITWRPFSVINSPNLGIYPRLSVIYFCVEKKVVLRVSKKTILHVTSTVA